MLHKTLKRGKKFFNEYPHYKHRSANKKKERKKRKVKLFFPMHVKPKTEKN